MKGDLFDDLMNALDSAGVRIVFGLRAQGHVPTVERMLASGFSWDQIGRSIGWYGPTVKEFYEREKRKAKS